MLQTRIIPCLQLIDESLVKTVKFGNHVYIGDPVNTVRIFNELAVDELCFLDIRATVESRQPNYKILSEIADECFMPLSYGGGLNSFDQVKKILGMGFEKVVINSSAFTGTDLIVKISEHFGNQSIIASVDVKKNMFGKYQVYSRSGTHNTRLDPVEWVKTLEKRGVGELLITSIDKDGTWEGYDLELIRRVSAAVRVPVIANGGAGTISHLGEAVKGGKASALAVGSMVVFQGKGLGVLVNFPDKDELESVLNG